MPGSLLPARGTSIGPITIAADGRLDIVLTPAQQKFNDFRFTVVGPNGVRVAAGAEGFQTSNPVNSADSFVFGGESYQWQRRQDEVQFSIWNDGAGEVQIRFYPYADGRG